MMCITFIITSNHVCPQDCVEFNAVRHVVDITQPGVSTKQQLDNQLQKKINLKLRKAKVCCSHVNCVICIIYT